MSAVEAALAARLGGPVSNLARLSGGASRETWSFDADGRPLILRREQPGGLDTSAMAREAALLVSAADAGVPVPALVDHGDDLAGAPFLIMERLSGETIPRRLLRDERFADVRGRLARELGEILARLHTMEPVPGLSDEDPLDVLVAFYEDFREPRPPVELALRWLREPAARVGAADRRPRDFRSNNPDRRERGDRRPRLGADPPRRPRQTSAGCA